MEENNKSSLFRSIGLWSLAITGIFIGAVIVLIIYWYLVAYCFPEGKAEWGQFGDMFGGATALFSALAFIGLIITIILQKRELKLQRMELQATREEIKGQKEQLQMQNETMQRQNFENSFFQLLDKIEKVKDYIVNLNPNAFQTKIGNINKQIMIHYNNNLANVDSKTAKSFVDKSIENLESNFFHYINIVYSAMKYIYIYSDSRNIYSDVFRDRFSEFELEFLFYYGISEIAPDFRKMAESFNLFRFQKVNKSIVKELSELYNPSAFGG
jgi:hypothetical protein